MSEIQKELTGKKGDAFLSAVHDITVRDGISDIHFFPKKEVVELGWRKDGIMETVFSMDHKLYEDIVRRIKFTSKLSLNVTNIPQDGQYAFPAENRDVKVRVSSLPSKFGEVFTLRLLDPKKGILPLEQLGFQEDVRKTLTEIIKKPHGIMLVTGPTGSGKTTTLYSLLKLLVGTGRNIITLEDPVEYELEGVVQSQIDHKHGYDFAKGLRAILRQDPDVILVGEIRDQETAKVAANAALTGHMVFATLHTNSAIESIPRLLSMGVEQYLLAPALRAILAQRLVRKVVSGTEHNEEPQYKGRLSLPEVLVVDSGLRDLILSGAQQKEIEAYAAKHGFKTMRERGESLVKEKLTTLAEVARVTA